MSTTMKSSSQSSSHTQTSKTLQPSHAKVRAHVTGSAKGAATAHAAATARLKRNTDSFQPASVQGVRRSAASTTASRVPAENVNAKEVALTTKLALRPDLQPKNGVTHCNQFARSYATAMLGDKAQVRTLFAGNAHQQYHQLASAARAGNQNVEEVSADEAGRLAAQGKCVVVTTSTLSKGGHGHIAAVVGTNAKGALRTGQAGTTNYGNGPLSTRFTGKVASQAHYYAVG